MICMHEPILKEKKHMFSHLKQSWNYSLYFNTMLLLLVDLRCNFYTKVAGKKVLKVWDCIQTTTDTTIRWFVALEEGWRNGGILIEGSPAAPLIIAHLFLSLWPSTDNDWHKLLILIMDNSSVVILLINFRAFCVASLSLSLFLSLSLYDETRL